LIDEARFTITEANQDYRRLHRHVDRPGYYSKYQFQILYVVGRNPTNFRLREIVLNPSGHASFAGEVSMLRAHRPAPSRPDPSPR